MSIKHYGSPQRAGLNQNGSGSARCEVNPNMVPQTAIKMHAEFQSQSMWGLSDSSLKAELPLPKDWLMMNDPLVRKQNGDVEKETFQQEKNHEGMVVRKGIRLVFL